jgi:hypothetical protein
MGIFTSVWSHVAESVIELEASRIVLGAKKGTSHKLLYDATQWEELQRRRDRLKLGMMFKITNNLTSDTLQELIPTHPAGREAYNFRNAANLPIPQTRTAILQNSFIPATISLWNDLSDEVKGVADLEDLKKNCIKPPTC